MIRGRIYNRMKGNRGGDRENQAKGQIVPLVDVAEKLGEKMGVSGKTIKRDGKFADAVDKIGVAKPEAKAAILNGTATATKAEVIAAGDARCGKCRRIFKNSNQSVPGCPQCAEAAAEMLGKKRKPAKPKGDGTGRIAP